jgi:hypothetical protein
MVVSRESFRQLVAETPEALLLERTGIDSGPASFDARQQLLALSYSELQYSAIARPTYVNCRASIAGNTSQAKGVSR